MVAPTDAPLYLRHFGLQALPFRLTPDTRCFFSGADRGDLLLTLQYSLTHGDGISVVTGEVGTGKTTMSRMLMAAPNEAMQFLYLANPAITPAELPLIMAHELGIDVDPKQPLVTVSHRVQQALIKIHAEGRQVVLLVDEAHEMPIETLQQIRLISNLETSVHKLLQIVLFGQPELDDKLRQDVLRPLRERISNRIVLAPMTLADVRLYLDFRISMAKGERDLFDDDAVKMIFRASEGLARRVNILADKCLLAAFLDQSPTVRARHAHVAQGELSYQFARSSWWVNLKSSMARRLASVRLRRRVPI